MQLIKRIQNILFKTSNREKIVRNVSWAVTGKIVNVLYGLFIGVLVARYLGPDQFGLMNYVISYVTIFSIIAAFGMDSIEVRELAKSPEQRDSILGTAFSIRLALSFLTILLIFITLLVFESDRYTFGIVMIYSLYLITSPFNVIRNYFTSIVLNEYIVKTEILRTLIAAGIKIVLLLLHSSLTWFIIANTFDFFFIAGGYVYAYRKKVSSLAMWHYNRKIGQLLIWGAFPLVLSGTATIIYQRIDQIMIRNLIDTSALGQFAVALRITDIVIFIPSVIATTITPILVRDRERNFSLYLEKRRQFMDGMVWSSILLASLVTVFASLSITILFGVKYAEAIPVLQVLAWKTVFIGLFVGSGQIMIIENIQKWAVFRNVLGMIICVILNLALIPRYGIMGSAVTTLITMAVTGFLAHLLIKPYRFLFKLQINSLIFGWKRLLILLYGYEGK